MRAAWGLGRLPAQRVLGLAAAVWLLGAGCSKKPGTCMPLYSMHASGPAEASAPLAAERCTDPGQQPGVCGEDGLCLENPTPASEDLFAVWGADADHVWATGRHGAVLFWNGRGWQRQTSAAQRTLLGLGGSSPSDVWAVEQPGLLHRFDGHTWQPQPLPAPDLRVAAVWVAAAADVWLQGRDGRLLRGGVDGWNLVRAGSANQYDAAPRRVWGHSGQVWAFDATGAATHWDGRQLHTRSAASGKTLHSLWGPAADSVYGLASEELWHWDGQAWSTAGAVPPGLSALWGSSEHDIWGVGTRGVAYFDGLRWQSVTAGDGRALHAIWGSRRDDIWAVGAGGTILHFDGQRWSGASPSLSSSRIGALWGSSARDVWAVGALGRILHWDGTRWCQHASGSTAELFALWGSTAADVWAAGSGETILHWDGRSWRAAGGSGQGAGHASGLAGRAPRRSIYGLWGSSPSSVWAAGQAGLLRHFDGQAWRQQPGIPCHDLQGIWGASERDIWAVGQGGAVLHWDGSEWRAGERLTNRRLTSVWGRDGRDVWVAGLDGVVLHWVGERWERVSAASLPREHDWSKVWVSTLGEVWLLGSFGQLWRTHGDAWQSLRSPTSQALTSLWSVSPEQLWIGGTGGVLIHRRPEWLRPRD